MLITRDELITTLRSLGTTAFKYGDNISSEAIFNLLMINVDIDFDAQDTKVAYATIKSDKFYIAYNTDNILSYIDVFNDKDIFVAFARSILKHELFHVALKHLFPIENKHHILANIVMDALINNLITETSYVIKHKSNVIYATPELTFAIDTGSVDKIRQIEGYNHLFGTNFHTFEELLEQITTSNQPHIFYIASNNAINHSMSWEQYYDYILKLFPSLDEQLNNYDLSDLILNSIDIQSSDLSNITKETEVLSDYLNGSIGQSKYGSALTKLNVTIKRRKPLQVWQSFLKYTFSQASSMHYDYSYSRVDRRFDMPPARIIRNKSTNVLVMIDASGSISKQQLELAISEIQSLYELYKITTHIVIYDTDICFYGSIDDYKKQQSNISIGGGTDLNKVIDLFVDKYKHKQYGQVVVISDCEDDPVHFSKFKKLGVKSPKDILILSTNNQDYINSFIKEAKQNGYKFAVLTAF